MATGALRSRIVPFRSGFALATRTLIGSESIVRSVPPASLYFTETPGIVNVPAS